jgi:peroxiredoxin
MVLAMKRAWTPRALLLVALLAACGSALPASAAGPGIGDHAPPIELRDLDGTPRTSVWGEGAPPATVVFFFDPQNPDCLFGTNFLDTLYSRAHDFGLALYAVEARGRQPAEVAVSMERYCRVYRQPGFPILPDPAFRTSRTYGVERVPITFIMESHGVILNRIEGFAHDDAVAITRRIEQLLRRDRGFLSASLREAGISEAEERAAETKLAEASELRSSAPEKRALAAGDRLPELEFSDYSGRSGRWRWGELAPMGLRVLVFFNGSQAASLEALTWLDRLARRGLDAGLEVLAVEVGGMDTTALQAAIDKYRRYNPDPSFPLVADADGRMLRAFGPWEKLPQTYLIDADGTVVFRSEGFSEDEAGVVGGKVARSYLLAGRPFPSVRPPSSATGAPEAPPADEEAPSIRRKREQDERYRSNVVLGDAAFMAWEFDRALTHYLEALEAQPRDLHALVRAAQLYERRGDTANALALWERVLAVRPDHVEAGAKVRELRAPR